MLKHLTKLSLIGISILLTSCVTKQVTVIDKSSDVVRLGKGVKGHIYVYKNNQWIDAGVANLPEGWYAGPGPK